MRSSGPSDPRAWACGRVGVAASGRVRRQRTSSSSVGVLPRAPAPSAARRSRARSHQLLFHRTFNGHREWTQDGQLWVQYVSSTPATRIDVINLQEHLDHQLQQRQARETGICPIREELYAQCFDELIRQTTMNCLQRGLLLVRVRDEIRMTIAAYQTLYESSIAFGMRKALMAEQRKGEMRALIASLSSQKAELEAQVASLEARIDDMQREEERRAAEEKREHEAEVAKLRETHDSLKTQLEDLLAPPGKK